MWKFWKKKKNEKQEESLENGLEEGLPIEEEESEGEISSNKGGASPDKSEEKSPEERRSEENSSEENSSEENSSEENSSEEFSSEEKTSEEKSDNESFVGSQAGMEIPGNFEETSGNDVEERPGESEENSQEEDAQGEKLEIEETESTPAANEKKSFFTRLKEGLAKTRNNIVKGIDRLFSGSALDDDFYEELEEILIMGDIGVNATTAIIDRLKAQVKEKHIKEPKECKELLIQSIREQMEVGETAYEFESKQSIIMVIGVNGVGKTTTVGKLAWKLKDDGKKVLIAAADTFRAAAGDQLAEWANRAGVPMIGGKEGADPASVVFDAVNAAKARGIDTLLIDTAGRLHNKKNLMEELRKMNRIIDREFPNAHRENLIVLDGTTGQNALVQAREFGDVANLTGIVLTKMDGTAKGGIAVAIVSELQIPVKYIGVGETTQDLQKFDPDDFVKALFDVDLSENDSNAGKD